MKKKITLLLTITLLTLSACGSDNIRDLEDMPYSSDSDYSLPSDGNSTSTGPTSEDEVNNESDSDDGTNTGLGDLINNLGNNERDNNSTIKVGIINIDPNESYYRNKLDNDLKRVFTQANGYDANYFYSYKNDEQISAAEKFISDNMDYLLICASDSEGWDSVLTHAKESGVNVILYDRKINVDRSLYITSIVSDLNLEGEMALNWLKSQNLPEYNIINLQGAMGSAAQIGRTAALDEQVNTYSNWNYVCVQSAEWNSELAHQTVQSVINTGASFNVIFAENDDMARGAVEALDQAGISHGLNGTVKIIGFDCNKWALQEVYMGNWDADIQYTPFQADTINQVLMDYERGYSFDQYTILEEKVFDAATITYEDVEKYGL